MSAGLVRELALSFGGNIGDDCAVFESVHGSAPKYAGQNKVNPTALILSGVLMLRHLGEHEAAERIFKATSEVIAADRTVTYDLGGRAGTSQMADAIIEELSRVA